MLRRLFAFSLFACAPMLFAAEVPPAAAPAGTTPAGAAPGVSPAPAAPGTAPVPAVIAAPEKAAGSGATQGSPGATMPAPTTPAPAATPGAENAPVRISVNHCNVEGPFIAITFDDGPHGVQTPRLLKMLRERGIKATFFLVGQCVAANPEIAKQIVAEGHEVANHSWSHPSLSKMATDSVRDQLGRTHNVISQEAGVAPTLMRPPFGNFTVQQRAWAHATWGYQTILWDVDSLDWKHRNPAKTESIILSETKAGSIILCHDIHKTTVDAMPATLDKLIAKGFKFVTVTELLKMHREPAAPVKGAAKRATAKEESAPALSPKEAEGAATSIEDLQKPATATAPAPAVRKTAKPVKQAKR